MEQLAQHDSGGPWAERDALLLLNTWPKGLLLWELMPSTQFPTSPKLQPEKKTKDPELGKMSGRQQRERVKMLEVTPWRNWEKIKDLF